MNKKLNTYEQKKADKVERLREAADKLDAQADRMAENYSSMAVHLPVGQPVLKGHYSEKADINFRNKLNRTLSNTAELRNKAEELREKAKITENNKSISGDDPDAILKLREKIEKLEDKSAMMKKVNAYYRKHKTCVGCDVITEKEAKLLDENAACWGAPFRTYQLSYIRKDIKTATDRIKELEAIQSIETDEIEFPGGTVVFNKDANRVQFFFDNIPSEEERDLLKSHGFKFSRTNDNAWQRQLTMNAVDTVKYILEKWGN